MREKENPASATLRFFRLPALDITKLNCSASPFTSAPLMGARDRRTSWGVPTRCGDDKTRCVCLCCARRGFVFSATPRISAIQPR
jgi:hypothetical protein